MRWMAIFFIVTIVSCKTKTHESESSLLDDRMRRGFASDSLGHFSLSIRIYDSVLNLNAASFLALVNRGRAKVYVGDTVAGLADLNASIKIHPTLEGLSSKVMIEWNRNPQGAFNDIQLANKLFPNEGMVYLLMTEYFTNIQPQRDSALYYADRIFTTSVRLNSVYAGAEDAYLTFQEYPRLIKAADSFLAHYPDHAYTFNNKGLAQLSLGNITDAKKSILTSLKLDSTNAWAYRNMALLFEKMKRADSSCYYIQKARQKDFKKEYSRDIDSLVSKFCSKVD